MIRLVELDVPGDGRVRITLDDTIGPAGDIRVADVKTMLTLMNSIVQTPVAVKNVTKNTKAGPTLVQVKPPTATKRTRYMNKGTKKHLGDDARRTGRLVGGLTPEHVEQVRTMRDNDDRMWLALDETEKDVLTLRLGLDAVAETNNQVAARLGTWTGAITKHFRAGMETLGIPLAPYGKNNPKKKPRK